MKELDLTRKLLANFTNSVTRVTDWLDGENNIPHPDTVTAGSRDLFMTTAFHENLPPHEYTSDYNVASEALGMMSGEKPLLHHVRTKSPNYRMSVFEKFEDENEPAALDVNKRTIDVLTLHTMYSEVGLRPLGLKLLIHIPQAHQELINVGALALPTDILSSEKAISKLLDDLRLVDGYKKITHADSSFSVLDSKGWRTYYHLGKDSEGKELFFSRKIKHIDYSPKRKLQEKQTGKILIPSLGDM